MVWVSTREDSGMVGLPWTALYSASVSHAKNGSLVLGPANRLTPHGVADFAPVWSPDGTFIAFTSTDVPNHGTPDSTSLFIMTHDGRNRTKLATPASGPCISPDGKHVYYHVPGIHDSRVGTFGIMRVAVAGGSPMVILKNAAWPSISSDGRLLAVQSWGWAGASVSPANVVGKVALFDLHSGVLTLPAANTPASCCKQWKPKFNSDSTLVAYVACTSSQDNPNRVKNMELWSSPPELPDVRIVATSFSYPVLSPDHTSVAGSGAHLDRVEVMNIDGSNPRVLVAGARGWLWGAAFAPNDPTTLLYSCCCTHRVDRLHPTTTQSKSSKSTPSPILRSGL
jgi:Tol biopolymer transport system component